MTFVKSADTSTSVSKSKADIEKMLVRYGAKSFAVTHDYGNWKAEVCFLVKDSGQKDAGDVPIRIPVEVRRVYARLFGKEAWGITEAQRRKRMEQAERVAWRNLYLWIDASLSAAALELQTITEAFFAHAVIGPHGETARQFVIQQLDSSRLLAAGDANAE